MAGPVKKGQASHTKDEDHRQTVEEKSFDEVPAFPKDLIEQITEHEANRCITALIRAYHVQQQ